MYATAEPWGHGGDYYLDVLGEVREGGSAGCEPTPTWISLPTLPCSVISVPFRGIKLARELVSMFSGLWGKAQCQICGRRRALHLIFALGNKVIIQGQGSIKSHVNYLEILAGFVPWTREQDWGHEQEKSLGNWVPARWTCDQFPARCSVNLLLPALAFTECVLLSHWISHIFTECPLCAAHCPPIVTGVYALLSRRVSYWRGHIHLNHRIDN